MNKINDPALDKYTTRLRKNSKRVSAVVLGLIIFFALIFSSGTESYLLLDNTTRLEYVEDNRLGTFYVERSSPLPAYHKMPKFEACIYTSENSSPLIVPVETQDAFFFTGQRIKSTDLMVSIPEENLSTEGINQELEVTGRDRCPIRSDPRIVVAEKN